VMRGFETVYNAIHIETWVCVCSRNERMCLKRFELLTLGFFSAQ
jgi:hypothetical protein